MFEEMDMQARNDNDQLRTFDCGHEHTVGKHLPEVTLCIECYFDDDTIHFGVDDYPDVLSSSAHWAHYTGGTSKHINKTHLLGITVDRRAVYYREQDRQIWVCAPAHSRDHDVADPLVDAVRDYHSKAGPAPAPRDPDFHTLPNGDHIAVVQIEDERLYSGWEKARWVAEHAHHFRSVTNDIAELMERHSQIDNDCIPGRDD